MPIKPHRTLHLSSMHTPPPTSFRNAPREPIRGVNVSVIVPRLHLPHFLVQLPRTVPLSHETTVPPRKSAIPRTHVPLVCTHVLFRNPQRVTPASRFYLLAAHPPHSRPWTSLRFAESRTTPFPAPSHCESPPFKKRLQRILLRREVSLHYGPSVFGRSGGSRGV